ncbi:MAG: antitoxin VapB family protein [Candidatus Korarchaeota archaeon]|nr:antitoxin VapB family protein [Candidatus Korarchaeota archaeon]
MPKTITLSDDVYKELLRIKGKRSFSEVIRDLLKERRGNSHVLLMLFSTMSKERYKEMKRAVEELEEEFERWGQSLTRTS